MATQEIDYKKIELIMSLRNHGIVDRRVLAAIERVPRAAFVPEPFISQAYADQSLPIECGQTISQPFVVAYMTDKLNVEERHKVLEIGTGSGYQAAVLARLCRRVYTIERYRTLLRQAQARFDELKIANITAMVGDGFKGWPQQAPFDRIVVTAAAPEIPQELVDQLKDGGIMVLPVDTRDDGYTGKYQKIVRVTKRGEDIETENLIDVRFVPMVPGIAREL
ncbi:MAG: protein-L-isoaspartate(D-aspartate) O-methyltransferase [Hyphomicrobiales bacterium]